MPTHVSAQAPLPRILAAVQQAVIKTAGMRRAPAQGYAAALGITAVAIGMRVIPGESLAGVPFITFFPAIMLATFVGGRGPGIFAVAIGILGAWFFLIPPTFTFGLDPDKAVQLLVFGGVGVFNVMVVDWLVRLAEHSTKFSAHEQQLLRELQHRVKNHVQIVSSLLQIQARRADPTTQAALQEAGRRLATISTVYGSLYRSGHEIDFKLHLEELCHVATRAAPEARCEFEVNAQPVSWGMDIVMPLSLIASELTANALQHGIKNDGGQIHVTLTREGGNVTLTISDSGARLPDDFDVEKTKGLGLQLVRTLCRQLQGRVSASKDNMTRFMVEFPEAAGAPH